MCVFVLYRYFFAILPGRIGGIGAALFCCCLLGKEYIKPPHKVETAEQLEKTQMKSWTGGEEAEKEL